MAGSRKKSKAQAEPESRSESDATFDIFASVLLEQVSDHEKIEHDPLEAYVGKLMLRFYANQDVFCTRFKRGYQALLEELFKKNPQK